MYDPDTGAYRYNYALLLEIVGGLTFFLSVVWYLVLEWHERRRLRREAHRQVHGELHLQACRPTPQAPLAADGRVR